MSTLYVGDLHGKVFPLSKIDSLAQSLEIETVVQVGDFGAFWPGQECHLRHYFWKRHRQDRPGPRWIVSPGNHDNWDKFDVECLQHGVPSFGGAPIEMGPGLFYAPRGSMLEIDGMSHLFFGGATSTDKFRRVEGQSWWARESPTRAEFECFFDRLKAEKPDVVVTHEAPSRVDVWRLERANDPVARGLELALEIAEHQPKFWFFGHHHIVQAWNIGDTTFACCGIEGDFWQRIANTLHEGTVASKKAR